MRAREKKRWIFCCLFVCLAEEAEEKNGRRRQQTGDQSRGGGLRRRRADGDGLPLVLKGAHSLTLSLFSPFALKLSTSLSHTFWHISSQGCYFQALSRAPSLSLSLTFFLSRTQHTLSHSRSSLSLCHTFLLKLTHTHTLSCTHKLSLSLPLLLSVLLSDV